MRNEKWETMLVWKGLLVKQSSAVQCRARWKVSASDSPGTEGVVGVKYRVDNILLTGSDASRSRIPIPFAAFEGWSRRWEDSGVRVLAV